MNAQLRLRVSDIQRTKRSKRLSPEKRGSGASLVGAPVAVEAEIAERSMHSARPALDYIPRGGRRAEPAVRDSP